MSAFSKNSFYSLQRLLLGIMTLRTKSVLFSTIKLMKSITAEPKIAYCTEEGEERRKWRFCSYSKCKIWCTGWGYFVHFYLTSKVIEFIQKSTIKGWLWSSMQILVLSVWRGDAAEQKTVTQTEDSTISSIQMWESTPRPGMHPWTPELICAPNKFSTCDFDKI